MTISNSTSVAIIGCGLIGTQWGVRSNPLYSLSHAAAFSKHADCRLVALCDLDPIKARQAGDMWKVEKTYSDCEKMFAQVPVDIAVIAASTSSRSTMIMPALEAKVKVLVIEKPLATTLEISQKLAGAFEALGTKTIVNYLRRWDPSMLQLRQSIRAGELGSLQRLVGIYGKGLTNNGSHMIDLVSFLLDASPVRARALGSPLPKAEAQWSGGSDAALDAQIDLLSKTGQITQVTMLGTDASAFTCFELRLIGTQAIWELRMGGRVITCAEICADPDYAGYTIPSKPFDKPAHALEAMDFMVDEAVRLARGVISRSSCDAQMALRTAQTAEAVLQSSQHDGSWVAIPN